MGRHHRIWLAAGILLAIGGLAWLLLTLYASEPVYQGKRLGAWLAELDTEMPASNFSGTNGPAAAAIRQIGTNAIPYLQPLLKVRDSRLKTALIAFSEKHRWLGIRLTPARVLRRRALSAAFCLGPRGSPLMPDILELFRSKNYEEAFTVTEALGRMGYCNPQTIPALLTALDDPNASPDFHDRAALAFMQLSVCLGIVNTSSPDAFRGSGYQAAVPALLKALNAPDDMPLFLGLTLKPCCGEILKRIDPEAAAKAGAL